MLVYLRYQGRPTEGHGTVLAASLDYNVPVPVLYVCIPGTVATCTWWCSPSKNKIIVTVIEINGAMNRRSHSTSVLPPPVHNRRPLSHMKQGRFDR